MDQHLAKDTMLRDHLAARGVRDVRVLDAFRHVPREAFMPPGREAEAYSDAPTAIGHGQTISQPFIVAFTMEALRLAPTDRVLEVGTGSGYSAALLAEVAGEVHTIERLPALADGARQRLTRLGYDRVFVHTGDGSLGWPEAAPYDAIAVAAAGPSVPNALLSQLRVGGRLVIPVGPRDGQVLVRVTRESELRYREEALTDVRFVPLVGQQAWPSETPER